VVPLPGPADDKPTRTLTPYWVSLFVAITILLSLLAAGRVAEHQRLEAQHDGTARVAVQKMADDFEHHLDQLAEDAHLLAELLWQTGQDPRYPAVLREKVLRDGVHALSSAVHHCRGIAFSADGKSFDLAIDPDEDPALAPWLQEQARKAYQAGSTSPRLLGPLWAPGDRPFFVQAQNLPFGTVVAASDARHLFETLQHGRPAGSRFLLVDGAGTLWTGCGSFATCRGIANEAWNQDKAMREFVASRSGLAPSPEIPRQLHDLLAIPVNLDMAAHWHDLETGGTLIALGLLTSRSELQTRRQAERWRLMAIGTAMLLSAGILGVFLWRQRHRERTLHEQLRHAEELNRLEHQLIRAEKLASVGMLSAGLAHELGTPLAIIRGRAEILEEKTKLPEIRTILEQIDHISNTLRQVLDFSREQPVAVQPTDLLGTARTVAGLLDFRLRAKNLHLRIDPVEGELLVAADPDQLQQVLVNLVMNACDASGSGGRITLRARLDPASSGYARLEVTDNGCGIPAAKLEAVFDPFFTTKPKGEGTGLGLPVAASIVRNHQGQISLHSSEGSGTTVTVLWPVEKP
jgi:signal transduction histidine kinase